MNLCGKCYEFVAKGQCSLPELIQVFLSGNQKPFISIYMAYTYVSILRTVQVLLLVYKLEVFLLNIECKESKQTFIR